MGTSNEEADRLKKTDFEGFKNLVDWETPSHQVNLSNFYLARYPVTVAQYRLFAEQTEREMDEEWRRKNRFDNHPVVEVSWHDAVAYCEWLTEELKDSGWRISLPKEAQWEKAARDADDRIYPWKGDFDENRLNCAGTGIGTTSPVGCFPGGESPYGMQDMAGNVWEWCADWFGKSYYASSPSDNPVGPAEGSFRVLRGGSWGDTAGYCRVAFRRRNAPVSRSDFLGFRLSRS
jgi:formylglycine-generating enzyme required for sulfatase activity